MELIGQQEPKMDLFIEPGNIRALPKDLYDSKCSNCTKPQSVWALLASGEGPSSRPNCECRCHGTKRELKCDYDPAACCDRSGEDFTMADPIIICSLCFLYDSFWGQRRRSELDEFVADIEAQNTLRVKDSMLRATSGMTPDQIDAFKIVFPRDAGGKMTDIKHANDVMGKLVLVSRIYQIETANMRRDIERNNAVKSGLINGPQFSLIN